MAGPVMMATFTIGALGMAAAISLGNGAVFKLVPQFFPTTVGSVTGLVGAAGGLGGRQLSLSDSFCSRCSHCSVCSPCGARAGSPNL
jgi:nitrate/nitrite transporter NarK